MEKIRDTAFLCIGRAVMFGALAIGCVMLSFSFDMVLALHTGAILTLILTEALILKALTVSWQNPKRTEVWMYLDTASRPANHTGKAVFATVLRDVYTRFARNSFAVACLFFTVSLVLRAARMA